MLAKLFFATLCVFVAIEARLIMVQDAPITSEGISLKISLKEDHDASGRPVASIRLYMDDKKSEPTVPIAFNGMGEVIPTFEDRIGIRGNGKCPLGTVWRGVKCMPVAG